jgi:hypothetical protein
MLDFDKRRLERPTNLKTTYKLTTIPCDTQMLTLLDPVPPEQLRTPHNEVLNSLQRDKVFEKMSYLEEGYLMPLDGTGYSPSEKLFSEQCLKRKFSQMPLGELTSHSTAGIAVPREPQPHQTHIVHLQMLLML